MENLWVYNENDKKEADKLTGFLPDRIFDVHAHIYRIADLNLAGASVFKNGPSEASIDVWRTQLSKFLIVKELHGGLFFPTPTPGVNIKNANAYLAKQVKGQTYSKGLVLVSPGMDAGELSRLLEQPGIVGMKPYHVFSKELPTWESSIPGFFPEWQMELANAYGSIVMLHLVKSRAIADPDNIKEIRQMSVRYPRIKFILAHAARSFHAPHAREGVKKLRGLENIWFDTSGICEPEALISVLNEFGPNKLMWGTDFPVSQIRGKCVTIGDGFAWLDENFCDWEKAKFFNPVIVGIESLRALKIASEQFSLNKSDIQEIFYGNAIRLLSQNEKQDITQEVISSCKRTDHEKDTKFLNYIE